MIGVLLVNLGSPSSTLPDDVYRYLQEFLSDPFVVDLPYLARQLLVRAIIVPLRYKKSAKAYEKVWLPEGSPLIYHGKNLAKKVQERLGADFTVELGMRYGSPSLQNALCNLKAKTNKIIVIPLFPQYADATTGSIFHYLRSIETQKISHFHDHPLFIQAWVDQAKEFDLASYDHIIFSYHGLPLRQVRKNGMYLEHCTKTTELITKGLNLEPRQYTMSFQSRLGPEKWLQPFTSKTIKHRAHLGDKRLLVFSPSFVADCLETTFELGMEAKEEFIALGGNTLDLVPSLNSTDSWVNAVADIIVSKPI